MSLHLIGTKFSCVADGEPPSEVDGNELASNNADDSHFYGWIEFAAVGDKYQGGGGAAPEFEVQRVA